MTTNTTNEKKEEFLSLFNYIEHTLHELPVGVLYDSNFANEKQSQELMSHTYIFEQLSQELGIDTTEFISVCRWHYERYPDYLSRKKQFGSYAEYMEKYDAPERITLSYKKLRDHGFYN